MTMLLLGLLNAGETGEIVSFISLAGGRGESRAEDMGLRVGKRIEMLSNGTGPVLVKVDESRIAVGRPIAMRIVVRR
jgi:ferrous iron transport protein A